MWGQQHPRSEFVPEQAAVARTHTLQRASGMCSTAFGEKHRLHKHAGKTSANLYKKEKRKKQAKAHGQPNNQSISAEISLARAEQTMVKCASH